jgi:hypothetical protein
MAVKDSSAPDIQRAARSIGGSECAGIGAVAGGRQDSP